MVLVVIAFGEGNEHQPAAGLLDLGTADDLVGAVIASP